MTMLCVTIVTYSLNLMVIMLGMFIQKEVQDRGTHSHCICLCSEQKVFLLFLMIGKLKTKLKEYQFLRRLQGLIIFFLLIIASYLREVCFKSVSRLNYY